jgi:hypothetical protein
MVLYSWNPDEDHSSPLVLWTTSVGYKPAEGEAFPMPDAGGFPEPKGRGTAYEVVHQSCHPSV